MSKLTTILGTKVLERVQVISSAATAPASRPVISSRPPDRLFISQQKRSTILCLVLALATLAFYNPVVRNHFTNFDDNGYVTENDHVHAGLTWQTVKWAFTSREYANWHPLTWLSHALDYQLFKLNPVGHHYINLLFHTGNAILLFLLLAAATGSIWPSFMVAALFALHPVNVESVAWAAERKNVLSMFFFLLTLHAYGSYARRGGVKRYLIVAGLFALGLMSKPEIITLPFVLLLWDYWPLRRMGSPATASIGNAADSRGTPTAEQKNATAPARRSFLFVCLEKVPLLLLSAGSAIITLSAQSAGNAVRSASTRVRFGNAAVAYVRYIGKAFWPVHLAALYPHLGRFLPTWQIIASAIVLVVLTALVLRARDRRYLVVGWFWFLGTLVPVIGLVQVGVQSMADRYAYLPYIGLFIAIVWGVAEIARTKNIPAPWLAAPSVVILLALGLLTRHQVTYWHDSETLWEHTLSITHDNYMAHDALAHAYADDGRAEEAITQYKAAGALHAYSSEQMVDVGLYEQTHGHVSDAIAQYARALDAATDAKSRAVALSLLGSSFLQAGDINRARMSYTFALQQNPENGVALVGSGVLAERDGKIDLAVEQMSHAMKVEPTDIGYLLLAQALRKAGNPLEAEDTIAQAHAISKDFTQAQKSAAQVLAFAGIDAD
jgi:protein O-mannosyl-transferase